MTRVGEGGIEGGKGGKFALLGFVGGKGGQRGEQGCSVFTVIIRRLSVEIESIACTYFFRQLWYILYHSM